MQLSPQQVQQLEQQKKDQDAFLLTVPLPEFTPLAESSPFISATQRVIENDDTVPPLYGVARIGTSGGDGMDECGFCSWNSGSLQISCESQPIPELRDIYSPREWKAFTQKIREIFHDNTCSICPLACFLPVIGCCFWCCAQEHCFSKRHKALDHLIEQENRRLEAQGLAWILGHNDHTPFTLTMVYIPQIRQAYEATHPEARKITQEKYPLQLVSPAQRRLRARQILASNPSLQPQFMGGSGPIMVMPQQQQLPPPPVIFMPPPPSAPQHQSMMPPSSVAYTPLPPPNYEPLQMDSRPEGSNLNGSYMNANPTNTNNGGGMNGSKTVHVASNKLHFCFNCGARTDLGNTSLGAISSCAQCGERFDQ